MPKFFFAYYTFLKSAYRLKVLLNRIEIVIFQVPGELEGRSRHDQAARASSLSRNFVSAKAAMMAGTQAARLRASGNHRSTSSDSLAAR